MSARKSVDNICASLAKQGDQGGKSAKSKKKKSSSPKKRQNDPTEELPEDDFQDQPDSDEDFEASELSEGSSFEVEISDNDSDVEAVHNTQPGTSRLTAPLVEQTVTSKPKKVSKANRDFSPLLDLLDVAPVTTTNFCSSGGTPYLSYSEEIWSPLFLYRLPSDIVISTIREHGTEGLGRIEIGRKMGMDTSSKAGNRRVSSYIVTACNEHPDHIGQFQKMEGKIRCIKYFWKAESEPEQFKKLFSDFEKATGEPCPFQLGQVIKFPNSNLSTLRVSDVTLRRLNDILEIVAKKRVIVTVHKLLKLIHEREHSYGYDFMIDKKSLLKCFKALEGVGLLRLFETAVIAESVENKIQIVCHKDISSPDDPEVIHAVQATIDEYHQEGRVFPHGQLRYSVKKRGDVEATARVPEAYDTIVKTTANGIDLTSRYRLLRLQSSRTTVMNAKKSADRFTVGEGSPCPDGETPTNGNTDRIASFVAGQLGEAAEEPPRPSRPDLEFSTEYGYQTKAIRCFVVHELVFQFVYGHAEGTRPTCFDLFPPGDSFHSWPVPSDEAIEVFVPEESPLRFLPPHPPFSDVPRGWFMLQDFLFALPLSAFVLIVHVNKKVNKEQLQSYLNDPIRRHICIGYLPNEMRVPLLKDKKVIRQLEHIMLTLCALGVMAIAPNPDLKRFASPKSSVFYVSRKGLLYDTSTSGRGYASVTLPLSMYDKYEYQFNNIDDVILYWHHLRAIVQSTPLAFRNDVNSEEISQARHKKYSLGLFDKSLVTRDPAGTIENIEPLGPNEGCAGFDSALYIHLRRHWDVDPGQTSNVGWFIARFRKQSDKVRSLVESRVANLKKDWNSYVKSLMPSEMELLKSKKKKNAALKDGFFPSTRAPVAIDPTAKKRPQLKKANTITPKGMKPARSKKRPMDSVDLISSQNRLHMRSKFNSRERDMLILIRAVGFFLNPVYRFWLDPAVVRDIMHENIPESRCKTVQSLMAAGVREMVRPARLAYLQRIVRNLSTFQEMRNLRFMLASSPLSTPESKSLFFKNAFDVANRLLFMESQTLPVAATSDKQFEDFLKSSRLKISPEQASSNPIPLRSQAPSELSSIHHCVAVNILLSILIHSTDGAFSESILDQISASVISNALQILRADGLVSRSRGLDPQLMVITKNQAVLSYYFRHFFAHRFHPDIVEQVLETVKAVDECTEEADELEGDDPGAVVTASSAFCSNRSIEVYVDEEVFNMFESAALDQSSQTIKQIRYLENADLHLEKIHVFECGLPEPLELPSWRNLLPLIDWSQPADCYPPQPFEQFLLDIPVDDRKILRAVYKAISSTAAFGAKLNDIVVDASSWTREEIKDTVKALEIAHQIISVGVDMQRWVIAEYATAWCVNVGGRIVCPRPWTMPTGEICPSTVRWMAESVLMSAVSCPGITVKEVCFRIEFALQTAAVYDMITILEAAGCVEVAEDMFENMTLSSPFQEQSGEVVVTYIRPVVDCVERFARIFGDIPLLPAMMGRSETEKEEMRVVCRPDELFDTKDMNWHLFCSREETSMTNGAVTEPPVPSWLSWSYWRGNTTASSHSASNQPKDTVTRVVAAEETAPSSSCSPGPVVDCAVDPAELSGWERIRLLYTQPSMERDCTIRMTRTAFLSGFLLGGASTYMQAHETYERSNVGRKYLSKSDAFKRRMDYAIVRFAKSGFVMGGKCALICGSIVVLSTHLAAYRQRFSSWYFPALSALVGGVFMFPLGLIGSLKAVGLGLTSGLTLSAVLHLYALSMDKSVNDAYFVFKKEYEKELRYNIEFERRVEEIMKSGGARWRADAVAMVKKQDEEKLTDHDA
ncbi:hypothetical protein Q1695_013019 [Nippostrongylus brasiliensis]|nr:hypothetical protein Q1695_013019 [Nippostrongylus brasiliensis]